MAIEGPLKELGIHDVFQLLDLSRKTGVLRVTSELRHNQGTVYFDNGGIIHAEIKSNPHRLGELLIRTGKVTQADLERAQDMQHRGDKRLIGEILLEISEITQRELARWVVFQIEEVIFEMMSWREGFFSFSEEPIPIGKADASVRLPIEALLLEGARRIDEWSRIERKIPHLGVVPMFAEPPEGGGGRLDLFPSEWEVLAAVDGERDVRAIAASLTRSEFEVAKTIFGLESAGALALVDRPAATAPPVEDVLKAVKAAEKRLAAGDLPGAREILEAALHGHPHDARLYLVMGKIHHAAHEYRDAEEQFRRALRIDSLLAPAHRLLGEVLARQGRLHEAVEWWERWQEIGERGVDKREVERALRAAKTLNNLLAGGG